MNAGRCLVRRPALQQHGILADRRIELLRDQPARPRRRRPVELRQRDEAEFGIAGFDELEGLRDRGALDDLRLQRVIDA